MSLLIKGMEMPTTGLYFVSVDNTGGRDKTVATVERMLGNRDTRWIVGSFELVPFPDKCLSDRIYELWNRQSNSIGSDIYEKTNSSMGTVEGMAKTNLDE